MMESVLDQYTKEELQQLVLRIDRYKLGTLLGFRPSDYSAFLKNNGLLSPLVWLKKQSLEWITVELVRHKSTEKMAKYYNVSPAFINGLYPTLEEKAPNWDLVQETWDRVHHIQIVSILLNIPVTELKEHVNSGKAQKPTTPGGVSKVNSDLGRHGEIVYMKHRKLGPEADMTAKDPNHPFDVMDTIYEKVNVKSAVGESILNEKNEWEGGYKFSLSGWKDCDNFGFMCFNKNWTLYRMYVIPVNEVKKLKSGDPEAENFSITRHNLHKICKYAYYVGPNAIAPLVVNRDGVFSEYLDEHGVVNFKRKV